MIPVNVTIMGQAYKLVCKEEEEDALKSAVSYLDSKMVSIRDAGKVRGNDRIAVMAAIAIAAELLAVKAPQGPFSGKSLAEVKLKISAMHSALDLALAPQENLF